MSMKIGYLGPEASFSHQAAIEYSAKAIHSPYQPMDKVIEALRNGEVPRAIVPVNNTLIHQIRDSKGIHELSDVCIETQFEIPVPMFVGVLSAPISIKWVTSKDRALEQCTRYLERLFDVPRGVSPPDRYVRRLVDLGVVQLADSTSDGMRKIKEERLLHVAGIGPKIAVEWYGLELYAKNVSDDPNARTTFAVLKKA